MIGTVSPLSGRAVTLLTLAQTCSGTPQIVALHLAVSGYVGNVTVGLVVLYFGSL